MADPTDDLSRLPQSERRRLIFLKSVAKYRYLGIPIDGNPRFRELIEQWIDGHIEMTEVASAARTMVETAHPTRSSTVPPQNVVREQVSAGLSPNQDISSGDALEVELVQQRTQDALLHAIEELVTRAPSSNPDKIAD